MVKKDHNKIDIIFLDFNMPLLNGPETARQIRNFEKFHHLHHINIISIIYIYIYI